MTTKEIQIVKQALRLLHDLVPDDEPRAVDLTPCLCPVLKFAKKYLVRDPAFDMSTSELYQFYREVSATGELDPLTKPEFLRKLPRVMAAVFDARKSHAIKRDAKTVRGFRGITLREQGMPLEHLVIEG